MVGSHSEMPVRNALLHLGCSGSLLVINQCLDRGFVAQDGLASECFEEHFECHRMPDLVALAATGIYIYI